MVFSKSLKLILAATIGGIVVSSTVLFPLIQDLNKTFTEDTNIHTPANSEENKTVQVLSRENKNTIQNSSSSSIVENPSLNSSSTITSTNRSNIYVGDTVNSKLLLEDIPN